jgi:hypothetical protein
MKLAARRTPPEVVTTTIAQAQRGERPTAAEVRQAAILAIQKAATVIPSMPRTLSVQIAEEPIQFHVPNRVRREEVLRVLENVAGNLTYLCKQDDLDQIIEELIDGGNIREVAAVEKIFKRAWEEEQIGERLSRHNLGLPSNLVFGCRVPHGAGFPHIG